MQDIKITFHKTPDQKSDTAVVTLYDGNVMTPSAKTLDKKLGGLISEYLAAQNGFTGKTGQTLVFPVSPKTGQKRVILVGLGKPEELDREGCELAGAKLFAALKGAGAEQISLFVDKMKKLSAADAAAFSAMGFRLRSYEFDRYQSKKEANKDQAVLKRFKIVTEDASVAGKLFARQDAVAAGVFLARDLGNEPPNEIYPDSFAVQAWEELKPLGVEVEIFDEKKMKKLGFGAHLAVGMGSDRQPRVLIMRWNGAKGKKDKPVAFVGKGVTFDTGGISIKPSASMDEMKLDMCGAAAVTGLMKTLALRKAKVNVVAIAALAENMPSHNAYRPGDIVTSLSGKTIEILNTDAEGRLCLIDSMTYVQKADKPKVMIDLATLTGAMMVALGHEYCGVFTNNNELWTQMEKAGKNSSEKLWRMPLDEAYRKAMESSIADYSNMGTMGRYAGACTAAGFLQHFVEGDLPWAHMDIAGVAWGMKGHPTHPDKIGTGFGVRVLDQWLAENYEK